jgi:hypothetical protein
VYRVFHGVRSAEGVSVDSILPSADRADLVGVREASAPNALAPNVTTLPEFSATAEFAYPAAMPTTSDKFAGTLRCP